MSRARNLKVIFTLVTVIFVHFGGLFAFLKTSSISEIFARISESSKAVAVGSKQGASPLSSRFLFPFSAHQRIHSESIDKAHF